MSGKKEDSSITSIEASAKLIVIILIIGGFVGGCNYLNDSGYIYHNHTVDLYIKGDWLAGENRTCTGFQSFPDGQQKPPQLESLNCADDMSFSETPHNISIKFWGKVSRPDMTTAGLWLVWKCTRQSDGFTCYALN